MNEILCASIVRTPSLLALYDWNKDWLIMKHVCWKYGTHTRSADSSVPSASWFKVQYFTYMVTWYVSVNRRNESEMKKIVLNVGK